MAYIGKVFKLDNIGNLTEVLLQAGFPEANVDKIAGGFSGSYTVKIDSKSDSSLTFTSIINGETRTTNIELNKDIFEVYKNSKYHSFYTFEGDVLKQTVKLPNEKTLVVTRKFSADKIEGTAQVEGGSKVCEFHLIPA